MSRSRAALRLRVLLPDRIMVDEEAAAVTAEAENGSFCLLPRHVDFVAALVPGLLAFRTSSGQERFLAVDSGILVKCGREVLVSTRRAVFGADLGRLRETVALEFQALDEREKAVRAASAKLEAGLIRRFLEMEHHG